MSQTKIASYVGFAIKSRSVVYGADTILERAKDVRLVLYDEGINVTSAKRLVAYSEKKGITIKKLVEGELTTLTHRNGVKAIAITNDSLAKAIEKEFDSQGQANGGKNG